MKIKELIEKRNALVDEQNTLISKVETEVRALTEDEEKRFNDLEKEIDQFDRTIETIESRKNDSTVEKDDKEERGNKNMNTADVEKRGIEQYLRKAPGEELRTMTYSSNGSLVPIYVYNEFVKKMDEVAPLFSMIPKLTPQSGTIRVVVENDLGSAGFVGEGNDLGLVDFKVSTVELKQNRAGSAIKLSQKLINDSGVDVVSYSNDLLFRRLGYALDRNMIKGIGLDEFEGLEMAPKSCEKETAAVGVIAIDDLMNMASSMKTVYESGAKWVMNRDLYQTVAAMKDDEGHFYITRAQEVDNRIAYKLFGLEIIINDAAENIYLVNFAHAYKGIIKKEMGLKLIDADQTNALSGTVTLVLDTYVDSKIVQPEAIRKLVIKK